jgi:hypothetical protein
MGIDYSQEHAAACVACLPVESSLSARVNPEFCLLLKDVPIKVIADAFRRQDPSKLEYGAMSKEDLDAWLKSKEVRRG